MADLSSILGGMVQGFKDFGTGLVDMFGTGGAAIGDAIESIRTGRATNKNQDDFRKWLYQTDNTQDAAAKGLGTILNGVQTVSDFIPGAGAVTRNPLFNGVQGAIGGVADEFKMAGKDYDLGRAAQRAGVGAASGLASAYTNQALGKTGNKLINNGLVRGAAGGALAGGIANAGYTGIEGGSVQDMINAGLYGAQTGALVGGTTGLARELIKPTHKMDASPLTEQEKVARIANIDDQISKLDTSTPEGSARYNELMDARQKYSGNKRLYRGLTQEYDANYPKNKLDTNGYESWTDNPELAKQYGEYVYYIDVPEGDIKTSYLDENPLSETYGDRNPIYSIDKKAGLNGVSGNEYLLSVDDPYKEGLTYTRMTSGKPQTVADLMNEPKQKTVADLIDDVKSAKKSSSTQVKRIGSAEVAPIDRSTLPKGWGELQDIIDRKYMDDITDKYGYKSGEWDKLTPEQLKQYILDVQEGPNLRKSWENRLDSIEQMADSPEEFNKTLRDVASYEAKRKAEHAIELLDLPQDQKNAITYAANRASEGWGDEKRYISNYADGAQGMRGFENNATAMADIEFSDRLGIGPSHTLKQDRVPHGSDAAGQYLPGEYTMATQPWLNKENAVSTLAHERLHSFQFEAPEGRYDKRVLDAYNELSKDLKPYIHDKKTIQARYKTVGDTEYWGRPIEQEARMMQQYLDNKGFTKNAIEKHRKGEWGNEINPAFDKFFKKLRALSKKGVALPAITALLGGGAIAGALTSGKDDKKKKSEVK